MSIFVVFIIFLTILEASAEESGIKKISKIDFGENWPFSVEKGILKCEQPGIVTFKVNNIEYAVNGLADTKGYTDIRPIWLDSPNLYQPKINIAPIINAGLELCGEK